MASLECSNSERQKRLREVNQESPAWNGIDYVEVENSQLIRVILFCDLAADFGENSPSDGDKEEVDIGEFVVIEGASIAAIETALYASAQRTITIRLKDSIAIGRYFLKVSAACPYFHLDPRFDGCDFEVFQSQQLEIDPRSIDSCSNGTSEPEISYTARDYSSFYRLISDRLALTMPQWRESHVPDIGVAITEIMAYVADHLAQFQDAVATEAYLSTARSRISARRHARLVDYNVDEGANSHTFLNFDVISDVFVDPSNLFFITKPSDDPQFDETSLMMSSLNELPSDAYLPYELAYVSKTSSNQPFRAEDVVDPLRLVVQLTFLPSPKESPWFELLGYIRSSLKKFLDALVPRDSGILVAWRTLQSLGQLSAFQLQTLIDALNYLTRGNSLLRYVDRNDLSSWANQMLDACHGAKDRTKVCRIVLMELFPDCFDRTTIDSQLELLASHNEIEFYTWNQTNCCLTVGATHATLKDQWLDSQDANAADRYSVFESRKRRRALRLKQGDYLLIEEVLDPGTGLRLDADRSHRQVVKLTKVVRKVDPVNQIPLLEVWWDIADSLTFAVCISATLQTPPCTLLTKASVARGNVFPADHGLTIQDEPLSPVQSENALAGCNDETVTRPAAPRIKKYRPKLGQPRLAFSTATGRNGSSDSAQAWRSTSIKALSSVQLPNIRLTGVPAHPETHKPILCIKSLRQAIICGECIAFLDEPASIVLQNAIAPELGQEFISFQRKAKRVMTEPLRRQGNELCRKILQNLEWTPRADLMGNSENEQIFVAEVDDDGFSVLRFGSDGLGLQPTAGTQFYATYRVGGGIAGNVGADSIVRVVFRQGLHSVIRSVRNPLPATGGRDAESLAGLKLRAAHASQELRRAITGEDYASIVKEHFSTEVQNVRCTCKPLPGRIVDVQLMIQAKGSAKPDLVNRVKVNLLEFSRVGHRLTVLLAPLLGVHLTLKVLYERGHSESQIRRDLIRRFSDNLLPTGELGFFHPNNFDLGDSIFTSRIISEALKVSGAIDIVVESLSLGDVGTFTPNQDVLSIPNDALPILRTNPGEPQFGSLTLKLRASE